MLKRLLCNLFVKIHKQGEVKYMDNNYYVLIKEDLFNLSLKVKRFGLLKLGFYVPIIIMDGDFERLFTKDEMRFAVYHEIAHCKLNHFRQKGRIIEQEIEADRYAANIVGKEVALSALLKLKEESRWCGSYVSVTELALRVFECSYL